jgi:putative ABC transport system substrate-binding protein
MRFIGLVAALAWTLAPIAAEAQNLKIAKIGVLSPATGEDPSAKAIEGVFDDALRKLGWVQRSNLVVERRFVGGRIDQFPAAARELVQLNVDLIVAWSPAGTVAAKNATNVIPIVFLAGGAAVEHGLVAGLPRPGGNLTGITFQANKTLAPKYLEMLKELIPKLSDVVVLRVPAEDPTDETENYEAPARSLNIRLRQIALHGPEDLKVALGDIQKNRPQALLAAPSGLLYVFRQEIAQFAMKHQLPAVYGLREVVEAGGLMSVSPSLSDIAARGASYVDKVLRGTKPGDLPVEQPTKFELVMINLKTAKTLGLTIPQTLLQRADEIIQ